MIRQELTGIWAFEDSSGDDSDVESTNVRCCSRRPYIDDTYLIHRIELALESFEEETTTRSSKRVLASASVELDNGNPWTSRKRSDLSISPPSALRKTLAFVSSVISTLMAVKLVKASGFVPRLKYSIVLSGIAAMSVDVVGK